MKKTQITNEAIILYVQQKRRMIVNFFKSLLLNHHVLIEVSLIGTGALVSGAILIMFVFGGGVSEIDQIDEAAQRQVTLSTRTIDDIEGWMERRNYEREYGNLIFLRSLTNLR